MSTFDTGPKDATHVPSQDEHFSQCSSSAALWLLHRDRLKTLREINRDMEMEVDQVLRGSKMWQFIDDVRMYGLYEAPLMCDEHDRDEIIVRLCEVLHLGEAQTGPRLPVPHHWSELPKTGVDLTGKPRPLRPEVHWRLKEHTIRELMFKESTKAIFERTLPPHISHKYIEDAKRDLYATVLSVPILYREQLCARLLKHYKVPLPPEPKTHVAGKRLFPDHPREIEQSRVMCIDKRGNAWTWNMGWYRVDEHGNRIDVGKPNLGWLTFKKHIKLADPEDFAETSFHYTRPWGTWRRGQGPVNHGLFGNGRLILTDGLHAVVDFSDGIRREVVFANLKSIHEKQLTRPAREVKERTPRTPSDKQAAELLAKLKMLL